MYVYTFFSGSSVNKMTTNTSQGSIYFCSKGLLRHCWPTTAYVYTVLYWIHTILHTLLKYNIWCCNTSTDRWTNTFRAGSSKWNSRSNRFCMCLGIKETTLENMSKSSKTAAIIMLFNFPYKLNLHWCSLCAHHWVIQDTTLWVQYCKLCGKTLGPPLLIVTTVLILKATGILWSSCCKLSELSFTTQRL